MEAPGDEKVEKREKTDLYRQPVSEVERRILSRRVEDLAEGNAVLRLEETRVCVGHRSVM
jgi:hypothetical protein